MNEANFLKRLEGLITGDGIWRDIPVSIRDFHLESDGATLTTTTTTNPGFAKEGTNLTTLIWAASKVVEAGLNIQVPGDYDESVDKLSVWLLTKMAGATDTPTITVEAFKHSDPTTDLAPDAVAALTSTYAWRQIDLDGNSILANDIIHLTLVPGTHGTDIINIAAVKVRYRGDIVIFDTDERSSGTPA